MLASRAKRLARNCSADSGVSKVSALSFSPSCIFV